jgi:toxin YoeB
VSVKLVWSDDAWDNYVAWQSAHPEMAEKINALIKDIRRHHFSGLGKPEPLRGDFHGFWSRRISGEHRLVYRVAGKDAEKRIEIAQCRYHYEKK